MMRMRRWLLPAISAGLAFIAGALLTALLAMRQAGAEEPAEAAAEGRFRIFQTECEIYIAGEGRKAEATARVRPTVFKIDTATGQTWIYDEEQRPDGTRKLQWLQVPWQGVRNPFGK
ncbi:MAG: hypothetical protein N3A66_06695 [Planctomycetota bacterium]|nr:hypothetical protein [Planctomycetota bacterium]